MITRDDIQSMVGALADDGIGVTPREIALVMLCHLMDCGEIAYSLLYGGTASDMDSMFSSPEYKAADAYYTKMFGGDALSYDEVKRGLEQDIVQMSEFIKTNQASGALEPKDIAALMGRISDMRVKLVDKFGTAEKSEEHKIVVLNKFNDICPWCGREVSVSAGSRSIRDNDGGIQTDNSESSRESRPTASDEAVHPRRGAGMAVRSLRGRRGGADKG